MKVTVTFDTKKIFSERTRPIFEDFLKSKLSAPEAAGRLTMKRSNFERHLAGIFFLAIAGRSRNRLHGKQSDDAIIRIEDYWP